MDIAAYLRVLRRFRWLVAFGLVLAAALATLSYASVSFDGGRPVLTPRAVEEWSSSATLFVTQPGFPWGQTVLTYAPGDAKTGRPAVVVGDPARFATLAALYAKFAESDAVRSSMLRHGPIIGTYEASVVPAPAYSNPPTLPMIQITAHAPHGADAVATATRVAAALRAYVRAQQDAAGISSDRLVQIQEVQRPDSATLTTPRKKTLPIVVFMAGLICTLAAAFILENARPVRRFEPGRESAEVPAEPTRLEVAARSTLPS